MLEYMTAHWKMLRHVRPRFGKAQGWMRVRRLEHVRRLGYRLRCNAKLDELWHLCFRGSPWTKLLGLPQARFGQSSGQKEVSTFFRLLPTTAA